MSANFEKKIICLITPGHLCNCPRLIKEASSLSALGHEVHIITSAYMPYLFEQDALVQQQHPNWHIHQINWEKGSWNALKAKIRHHFFKNIAKLFHITALYPFLLNRNFAWQLAKAKSIKADLYIAHSAASIAVAALAAKNNKVRFGFDAEDFHTGEGLSPELTLWVGYVQNLFLSHAAYITAGSPMIAAAYQKLLDKEVFSILNVFPQNDLSFENRKHNKPLHLFWFSQTIGKGRGLEWVFESLRGFKTEEVQLHLLGNLRKEDEVYFNELTHIYDLPIRIISYYKTISETDLIDFSMQFDIGLSLEPADTLNHDLCLGNKLFVYMRAGLGIIATDTLAQKAFLTPHQEGSSLLPLKNPEQLKALILSFILQPEKVNAMRQFNYNLAKSTYNWEKEQLKFISIVNQCLQERSSS